MDLRITFDIDSGLKALLREHLGLSCGKPADQHPADQTSPFPAAPAAPKQAVTAAIAPAAPADPVAVQATVEAAKAQTPAQATPPAAVPVAAAKEYTKEELAAAGVWVVDNVEDGMAKVQQLLFQFGARALPELPVDKYGAFVTALRQLGAKS